MRRWILAALSLPLVFLVGYALGLDWDQTGRQASALPGMPLALSASAAEALTGDGAPFPADEAGIAAYVRVGGTPDLEGAVDAFARPLAAGGNWVIGEVEVPRYPDWVSSFLRGSDVRVYVDAEGWLVAFLTPGTPPAEIMIWTGVDENEPTLSGIDRTALSIALEKVAVAAGLNLQPVADQIGYHHFSNPQATGLVLAASVGLTNAAFYAAVPEGATVFSESLAILARGTTSGASLGQNPRVELATAPDFSANRFSRAGNHLRPGSASVLAEPSISDGLATRYLIHRGIDGVRPVGLAVAIVYEAPPSGG